MNLSKKLITSMLVISIFLMPLKALSLENESFNDYEKGRFDGKAKAEKYGAGGFFWLGCLLSWLGFIISLNADPVVPQEDLIGKSESYILGYNTAYKEIAKSRIINRALIGSSINTAVVVIGGVAFFAYVVSEASKATSGCLEAAIQAAIQKACADAYSTSLIYRILSVLF